MTVQDTSAVAAAVADAHRREWAFVLAATVRVTRDLDVAEECVQEAFAAALTDRRRSGVPSRSGPG
jgi:RNA polymerase sigma-70 factor (ECF subfamily)